MLFRWLDCRGLRMSKRFLRKLGKVKTTGNLYASPAEESIAESRRFKKILGTWEIKKGKKEAMVKKHLAPKNHIGQDTAPVTKDYTLSDVVDLDAWPDADWSGKE